MKSFSGSNIARFVLMLSVFIFVSEVSAAAKKDKISNREPAGAEASLYKAKCASCHGALGEGSAKIAKMLKLDEVKLALTSPATQKASDADLLKVLVEGRANMPGFKGKISDEEAKSLIKYVRTLKK